MLVDDRGQRLRREDGATLVELLVVLVLMGVIGAVVTNSLVLAMRTTARSQDRAYSLTELQKSAERVGRELRSGTPVQLTASSATVDVLRGNQRQRYTFTVTAAGVLQQTRQVWNSISSDPAVVSPDTTTTTPITDRLVVTPSFTYFDRSGGPLAPPYTAVDRIVISLQRTLEGDPAPLRIDTGIELRNTHLNEL